LFLKFVNNKNHSYQAAYLEAEHDRTSLLAMGIRVFTLGIRIIRCTHIQLLTGSDFIKNARPTKEFSCFYTTQNVSFFSGDKLHCYINFNSDISS